jgi:hypothetical protein
MKIISTEKSEDACLSDQLSKKRKKKEERKKKQKKQANYSCHQQNC